MHAKKQETIPKKKKQQHKTQNTPTKKKNTKKTRWLFKSLCSMEKYEIVKVHNWK